MRSKKSKPDKQKQNQQIRKFNAAVYIKVVYYTLFVGFAFYFTAIFNKDLLLKLDELSIFQNSRLFFINHLSEPAGLLSYAASFLNQFFYFPWLGSLLFISMLIGIQYLTFRFFKIPKRYYLLSFIPAAALLLLVTQLDYVMYEFIANGYAFINVLGVLMIYLSYQTYKMIPSNWIKYVFALLYVVLLYPVTGFYALVSTFIMALSEGVISITEEDKKVRLISAGCFLLSFIFVPFIYYRSIYQVTLEFAYTAGLPEFNFDGNEFIFWLPVLLLITSLLIFSILPLLKKNSFKAVWANSINIATGLIILFGVYALSNKDENFHSELAIDHALFEGHWKDVLKIEREFKGEPSRYIVLTTRLALQKMQKAGDLMFTRKDGNKDAQTKRNLTLWSYASQPLFYNYGMVNDCYRWCMEDMARFGPKVQYLRYMVKCALINNELVLADKYNAALSRTLFHKKWAEKYQRYIDNPELMDDDPEFKMNKLLYSFPDNLVSDKGNLESNILLRLASIGGGHLDLLEISMQAQMLLKKPERFWPFFNLYIQKHDRIPVHYQEAALLFSQMNKQYDISNIKFDNDLIDKFNKVHSDPQNEHQDHFKKYYGDTYWYYMYYSKF
ncbi:DUF6057 family protein [Carboxylicivirga linearis]|uniref:Transmembrane protein n=1 Tax=Carboxylicivirga linearis TaxID=1628157 RepID=A0ABS5K1C1_9BACT|nr:DUF6057 family protein [Carboxylicivirga linearis]MBS2100918.1 hypothetical protein [Carboxylicivirga linearis]